MRIDTIFKFSFLYDYWDIPEEDGATQFEVVRTDIPCLVLSSAGSSIQLVCHEPMNINGMVRNLRDAKGNLVLVTNGHEYDLWAHTAEPKFDGFGRLIAWSHSLRNVPSTLFALPSSSEILGAGGG